VGFFFAINQSGKRYHKNGKTSISGIKKSHSMCGFFVGAGLVPIYRKGFDPPPTPDFRVAPGKSSAFHTAISIGHEFFILLVVHIANPVKKAVEK
jgi:hypothetical protein